MGTTLESKGNVQIIEGQLISFLVCAKDERNSLREHIKP